MNISVLGAGAWGTALACMLRGDGHHVTLWGHDPVHLEELSAARENKRYLAGIPIPAGLRVEASIEAAVAEGEVVILAVPSRAFRETARVLRASGCPVVSVTKGIELETGLTMSGILLEEAPRAAAVALSGPTLAIEVARGIPSAIVGAGRDPAAVRLVQELFHRPAFRVYSSADVIGVELGGALKNVVAIAAGACDGLGFGDNSKAGLLTRGLAEMRRLGVACGAVAETFSGLSGMGDLTVTCFSKLSRNRRLGERLARGESIGQIVRSTESVAEGYPTAAAARQLSLRHGVEAPIIEEVYNVLYEGKEASRALMDLIHREARAED